MKPLLRRSSACLASVPVVHAAADHTVDGVSLDRLLSGQRDAGRSEEFLMHYPHAPHRSDYFTSYRRGQWKVIYHYVPTEVSGHSHYQLFNLAEDPFEQQDLAPQRTDELRTLMQGLIASLKDHDAIYPVAEDRVTELEPKLP